MMDSLLLCALIGSGFALNNESEKQTRLIASIRNQIAEESVKHSTTIRKKDIFTRTKHQQDLVEKATKALEEKEYDVALFFAERLIKLQEQDPLYYVLKGDCSAKLGRISDAIENYDKALDINDQVSVLPAYLVNALVAIVEQLENVQKTILSSKNKPTAEEITKMLDEIKRKQTIPIEEMETDLSVENDQDVNSSVTQFLDINSAITQFLSNKPKDTTKLFKQLDRKTASNHIDRLVLYAVAIDTLQKLQRDGGFLKFLVNNCRLPDLIAQFAADWSDKSSTMYADIGWLPDNLSYIATQRGYHLHDDPEFRGSPVDGGSMYQRCFVKENPIEVARIVEEMLLLATADKQYTVEVNADW